MKITKELYKELSELTSARLNELGQEVSNPKPLYNSLLPRPLTIQEQIQRLMRGNLSLQAQQQGLESFEESEDFDVHDDFDTDPSSKYEMMKEEIYNQPSKTPPQKQQNLTQKQGEKTDSEESEPAQSATASTSRSKRDDKSPKKLPKTDETEEHA